MGTMDRDMKNEVCKPISDRHGCLGGPTLNPFLRLPVELIIEICLVMQVMEHNSYVRLRDFMGTCQHMRRVAISTPKLWTWILCVWRPKWLDLCVERARNQPLHIEFIGCPAVYSVYITALKYLPRATSAIIDIGTVHYQGPRFNEALKRPAPLIRSIRVGAAPRTRFCVDHAFLGGHHSNLTSLELSWGQIMLPLCLPHLRNLSLDNMIVPFFDLLKLLHGSLVLEEIHLGYLSYLDEYEYIDPSLMSVHVIPLDTLRKLDINDTKKTAWMLLNHFPNPCSQLSVTFDAGLTAWPMITSDLKWQSSMEGEDAAILSRVQSFYQERCHGSDGFPPMSLTILCPGSSVHELERHTIHLGYQQHIGYTSSYADVSNPSMSWQTPCEIDPENPDPVCSHISTLALDLRGHSLVLIEDHKAIIGTLTGLEHLSIRNASAEENLSDIFGVQSLLKWAREHTAAHGPLESIEFVSCAAKMQAHIDGLSMTDMTKEVRWVLKE
jgi:hypothetical protein